MIESIIYQSAVKKTGKERTQFVDAVCGASDELRESVESMISTHERNTGYCGGDTISLVLDRHQREPLSKTAESFVPPIHGLRP